VAVLRAVDAELVKDAEFVIDGICRPFRSGADDTPQETRLYRYHRRREYGEVLATALRRIDTPEAQAALGARTLPGQLDELIELCSRRELNELIRRVADKPIRHPFPRTCLRAG
jgi:hypothetical protein